MGVNVIREFSGGNITTAGTVNQIGTGGDIYAGQTLLIWTWYDNLTATTPTVSSIDKPAGETATWTKILGTVSVSSSSAGAVLGELWGITTTVDWIAFSPTITISASVTKKGAAGSVVTGVSLTKRSGGGAFNGTTTNTSAALNSGGYSAGDLVVGFIAHEANVAISPDTSTEGGGTWTTGGGNFTTGGGSAANIGGLIQHLITTTGTQNIVYGPTVSGDWSSGVVALPPAVPTPISSMAAAQQGPRSITLSWKGGAGADYFQIERSPDGSTGWTTIKAQHHPNANLSAYANKSIFIDHSCTPGTTYYYRVTATNGVGAAFGSVVNATSAATFTSKYNKFDNTDGTVFTGANGTGDGLGSSASGTTHVLQTVNKYDGPTSLLITVVSGESIWYYPSTDFSTLQQRYLRVFNTFGASSPGAVIRVAQGYGTAETPLYIDQSAGAYRLVDGGGVVANAVGSVNTGSMHRIEVATNFDGEGYNVEARFYNTPGGSTPSATIGPLLWVPPQVQTQVFHINDVGFDPLTSVLGSRSVYLDEPRWTNDTWIGVSDFIVATPIVASDTLSVAVTDTASIVVTAIAKSASDTLSAAVTDSGVFGTYGNFTSDTLSASVTEGRSFGTVAVVASDTLSASVSDVGTLPPINVTASDTLSASVTDATSSIKATITASDTPTAAVTDSRATTASFSATEALTVLLTETSSVSGGTTLTWSDTNYAWNDPNLSWGGTLLTSNQTKTASDTLSVSVTDLATLFVPNPGTDSLVVTVSDIASIAVGGTVTKSASDTLSASATELSAITAPQTASDTLSAAVTETSNVQGQIYLVTASDTLSASVDDLTDSLIPVTPDVIYTPITAQFTFDSNTQGFVPVLASNATSTWDQSNGNPAPSLRITRTGKNNIASQSYWELVTTWEALGVENGGVVTEVHLESAWNRVTTFTNGTGVQVGPYDIRNGSGALIGTLWSGRAVSATDAGTTITTQPGFTPSGGDEVSDATIRIRLYNTIGTTNIANPSVAINDDQITLTVTYTPPTDLGEHFDDLNASVTETANIVVTAQTKTASDTLSASVTDNNVSTNVVGQTISASDTLSASVTDTSARQTTFTTITAVDTLSAADTEISMVFVTLAGTNDTLSASVTETSKIRMPGGLFPAYDSDVIYDDVAEYNGGGQIQKVGSDTLSASVTESTSFATINISASDTLSVNVNDVAAIKASRTTTDTLSAAVTESTAVTAGSTAVDTLAVSVTESIAFAPSAFTTTDTLSVSVTETRSFGTIQISAADALTAMLTENTGGTKYFSTADTLTAMATEFTQRLVNGNIIITSGDSLNVTVTETTVFATIPRTASDSLAVSVTETAVPKASFSSTDTLTASITDTSKAGVQRLASDTLSVSVTSTAVIKASSKYQAIVFDENNNQILTVPMLWTGTAFIEVEQFIWTGSDWV